MTNQPKASKLTDFVTQTTWGSRDGADADDTARMIRLPRYGSPDPSGRKSETFDVPCGPSLPGDILPAYESNIQHTETAPLMNTDHYE